MSVSFTRRKWAVAGFLGITGLVIAGSPALKGSHPAASEQSASAVRVVPSGTRVGARPGEKGATYYSLEAQSTRVTTEYRDGTKAIAERNIDGTIKTALKDVNGNDIHRVRVDHLDGARNSLALLPPSGSPVVVEVAGDVHPTLEWANHQAHKFYEDRVTSDTMLQWKEGVVRSAASPAGRAPLDDDVRLLHTEWAHGLAAKTMRVRPQSGYKLNGRLLTGDVLTTKLIKNGADIGVANYFVQERIFAWKLQGVPDGWIATEHLKGKYGGWSFTPDLIWMNLQTIAKYHWWVTINAQGSLAENTGCKAAAATLASRVIGFVAPTLYANDAGCDPPLHWLDGTLYRYCCDVHDYCYEKFGCSASTWWRWFSSWSCDYCNMNAAWCFAGSSGIHPIFIPCPC